MDENKEYVFLMDTGYAQSMGYYTAILKNDDCIDYTSMIPIERYSTTTRGELVYTGRKSDIKEICPIPVNVTAFNPELTVSSGFDMRDLDKRPKGRTDFSSTLSHTLASLPENKNKSLVVVTDGEVPLEVANSLIGLNKEGATARIDELRNKSFEMDGVGHKPKM